MQTVLEGVVSIIAAIEAQSRPIERLLIQEGKRTRPISYLRRQAVKANIAVDVASAAEIDKLAGGKSHGGAVAIAGERRFQPIATLVAASGEGAPCNAPDSQVPDSYASDDQAPATHPFVVMLDGIEDPFNFGYAIRAIYAAGADGLVVRPRNWLSAAGTVARASAGASERIPTAVVETADDAAHSLRQLGLQVACTAREGATDPYCTDLDLPLFLVIGGEKRGITRSFVEQADILLNIPYGRPFAQSMGTAAATSVLAFEIMRQRQKTS